MQAKYIAKTFYGLETVLAAEIENLGGQSVELLNRAVAFEGDLEILYKVNLHARTALRVLKPILQFAAHNETVLYKRIRRYDWCKLFGLEDTLAIDSTVNSEIFRHSKYVALKVKDAIMDQFRDQHEGRRPSINLDNPTLRLNVHCRNTDFTISLDSSGGSLHKRGYRMSDRQAPLNEALAAGMVLLSGWQSEDALFDPMCGSGTILTEAAMIARNIPPRVNWNSFAFMNWSDYDDNLWKRVRQEAVKNSNKKEIQLFGSDTDQSQVGDTKNLIHELGFQDTVHLSTEDFFDTEPPSDKGLIIINPPYDMRIEKEDINQFYKRIGDHLKSRFSGWDAWILSGNKQAIKQIGLKTSKRLSLYNGPIECRFYHYELYKGSKK